MRRGASHFVTWLIFLSYTSVLLYLMFFGFHRTALSTDHMRYNLVPFKTIANYIFHYEAFGFKTWVINLFGNVVVFTPFGFLVPSLFIRARKGLLFYSSFVFVLILAEILQSVLRLGSFDVDDLILNTLGAAIGFRIYNKKKQAYASGIDLP
ncbi:VanZ family protein [Paenibacillus sediminis]|uniref:Glycopeptide antibiotics resistance protein n=1 Tax=Paenibacillus sediminis TaxID=664909 RepID=A0ABS4H1Y3_9BACL|nr:VanZ family protein [Paenibacillus sediminis]MBP1936491.1 glycopeptide antibiotics resistance protein [Paenibacillus sediminis]